MLYGTCVRTSKVKSLEIADDVEVIKVEPLLADDYVNVVIRSSLESDEIREKYNISYLNRTSQHLD